MKISEKLRNLLSNTTTDPNSNFQDVVGLTQEEIELIHEIEKLEDLLDETRLQLEYLDQKFVKTGTTASVLARIKSHLN